MSKQRMVKDSFWTDPYIEDLDPSEKLLFIYLITNPLCNIAGIYEIKIKRIAYETGFDKDMVEKILSRFEMDGKLIKKDDWLIVVNFAKNQANNPNIIKGMQRIIEELPDKIKALKGFERLSHFTLLNLTLPNLSGENKIPPLKKEKQPNKSKEPLPIEKTLEYLNNIPPEDIISFKEKYDVNTRDVKQKADGLYNWCLSNHKTKKDYKAFLRNALNKDFGLK